MTHQGYLPFCMLLCWVASEVSAFQHSPKIHHNVRAYYYRQRKLELRSVMSDETHSNVENRSIDRRKWLLRSLLPSATVILSGRSSPAIANADDSQELYTKQTGQFGYALKPPVGFSVGKKPLPTHLDEVNFTTESRRGYQFGVTVDPVRIPSLSAFGTPEEVAAKVVMAEVKRDGVFDVTLNQDPMPGPDYSFLVLDYLSEGKRGAKRFIAKFYIRNQMLYVLTAQCKQDDYESVKDELLSTVDSFRVL